jgi:DNA-binding transcriptional MerR regulator
VLLKRYAGNKWTLEEFVSVVNEAIPEVLPGESGQRGREEVNARLVRHYTTLGMLDEPGREGKEARYSYRHLLQVLLLRRMLAQGYGTAAIDTFARRQSDQQLSELLYGKLELTIKPNPALEYLEELKKARGNGPAPAPAAVTASAHWARHVLTSGVELHVREDYQPASEAEVADILKTVKQLLAKRGR